MKYYVLYSKLFMGTTSAIITIAIRKEINELFIVIERLGNFFWNVVTWQYFLHILALLLIVLIIFWLRKEYKNWNRGWLSVLIQERIDESTKKEAVGGFPKDRPNNYKHFWARLRFDVLEIIDVLNKYRKNKLSNDLKTPYLPSWIWLIIFLLSFALFFRLSHTGVMYQKILYVSDWYSFFYQEVEREALANVTAILGGFVAIIFALVIFIAESIRESKDLEQKKGLLRASGLWFLMVLTVFSLLNFLWFKVTVLSLVLPILMACGIIYAFWRVLYIIIDPGAREENRIKLLKERMRRIIFDSVRERIGNIILLEKVGKDKEIKVEYTFSKRWLDTSLGDYIFIESDRDGWLSDINLGELNNLVKLLENYAQKLGFSIYLNTSTDLEGGSPSTPTRQSNREDKKSRKVYLLKRFGEQIPPTTIFAEDSKVILAIPREFGRDKALIEYLHNLVPHIFRFEQTEPSSNALRKELQGVKDQLVSAIQSVSLGAMEEIKETYLHLAETFLETIHQFGGGYSAEQARKERSNIFEGWNEVRWLSRDIRELLIVASGTNNTDVISQIAYLPIAIARRAIQAKDHFLFQEFVGYSVFLYHLSKDKPDSDVKRFMIDRSWRYIKELLDFYIEPYLNDRRALAKIADFKDYNDFSLYLFKIFKSLLKSAFDERDQKTFEDILDVFVRMFRHFDLKREHPTAEFLEQSLILASTEEEKEKITERLEFQKAKEASSEKIHLAKKQVLLDLAAKIFDYYTINKTDTVFKKFFETISSRLPADIKELTKVFDSARNFESEDAWGWDDREMITDGEVHHIDVHSKLDRLYCVKALQLLRDKTSEVIAEIEIPHSRNLAFLADERPGANNLTVILDSMISNPEQWEFVLDATALSKVPDLKEALKRAREKQEKDEETYLETAEIDTEKLGGVKKELLNTFKQAGQLRPLVNRLGIYNDLTDQLPEGVPSWGYNQVDRKEILVKNWHVHFAGFGEQYGRGMAHSEDELAYEAIVNGITNKRSIEKQEIISEIERVISKTNLSNPVVIQSLGHLFEYGQIRNSEVFVPEYHRDCPQTPFTGLNGYIGVLNFGGKSISIINVFVRKGSLKNKAIITDLKQLGSWNQYSPIEIPADESYREHIFYLRISDLNKDIDLRNKIIVENPGWLSGEADREAYLKRRISIKIYEKFKFIVQDPSAGVVLEITDSHTPEDEQQ